MQKLNGQILKLVDQWQIWTTDTNDEIDFDIFPFQSFLGRNQS